MRKISDFLAYLLIRALEVFLWILPRPIAMRFGEMLGVLMSFLIFKRRRLIDENLKNAFPEKSAAERNAIAAATWKSIGRTAAEFVRMNEITGERLSEWITIDGEEHVRAALAGKKGVIFLTGHFTNWELVGAVTQHLVRQLTNIARPIKNPWVEKWIQSKRAASGMKIILHRQAVKATLGCLRRGECVGILMDQNLYTGGVFVNFFGRPAATTTLPALLYLKTGCPVILIHTLREGDRFRVVYSPPFEFPPMEKSEASIHLYTQIISDGFEALVRQYPENWFWIHNRWKRRPETSAPVEAVAS